MSGSKGLIEVLRGLFQTFGISEEISSDGGTEFMSGEVQKLLSTYGVEHRISSVGNPHSNQRAEVVVKSRKRLLKGNVGPQGNLNNEAFTRAILQYRNTITQTTGISPAVALFGRPLRDFVPLKPKNYLPSPQWLTKIAQRERVAAKASAREHKKWSEHSKSQPQLKVGDVVSIQNLIGNHPLKWDRIGVVVAVLQNDQYRIRVDGSGRVTLRNRKNLRVIGFRRPKEPFPVGPVITCSPKRGDEEKV